MSVCFGEFEWICPCVSTSATLTGENTCLRIVDAIELKCAVGRDVTIDMISTVAFSRNSAYHHFRIFCGSLLA